MFKKAEGKTVQWVHQMAVELFDPPLPRETVEWGVNSGNTWVWYEDDEPVAFFILGPAVQRHTLRVLALGVVVEWQRIGLGRKLVEHIVSHATMLGFNRLVWEVAVENATARRLYERIGARETGIRPNYYDHGDRREDAVCYALPL